MENEVKIIIDFEFLGHVFKECEEKASLDFATTKAMSDGDSALKTIDGQRGMWLRQTDSKPWETAERYIAHNLTAEQRETVIAILAKYFKIYQGSGADTVIIIAPKEEA